MAAYVRRSFSGNAAATTLSGSITGAQTAIAVTAGGGTNYPDGSGGNFWIVIDRGLSTEEKILCSARTTDTFTAVGRGGVNGDGTTAQAHASGAAFEHVITKNDADEANYGVSQTVGQVTSLGDQLVGSGANALSRKAIGTTGQLWQVLAGNAAWGALPDASITTAAKFAAGVVDNTALGALAVTAAKIAAATITDAQVAAANKDGVAGTVSMRTLGTAATQAAAGNDARLSDSRTPSGAAGGDLTGTYPNPTIGAAKVTAAALAAALPLGWVAGSTPRTSAQLTIGNLTDITGTSITWTAVANRKYLYVPENVYLTPDTIGDRWVLKIFLDGIQIGVAGVVGVAAAQQDFMASGPIRFSTTAASHTIKVQAALVAGSGLLSANGSATSPISADIFDMGGT